MDKEERKEYDKKYYEKNKYKWKTYYKDYYQKHKDKIKKEVKQRRTSNPDEAWKNNLWVYYRIRPEDYYLMEQLQNFKCAVCKTDKPSKKGKLKRWHIDHCHNTKKVRGLLCARCNYLLGILENNLKLFQEFAKYRLTFPLEESINKN